MFIYVHIHILSNWGILSSSQSLSSPMTWVDSTRRYYKHTVRVLLHRFRQHLS